MTTASDDLIKELREIAEFPPDCSANEAAAIADVASRAADEIKRLRAALRQHETFAEVVLQHVGDDTNGELWAITLEAVDE